MFALTYTMKAFDDHLPSFLITASGTRFAPSVVASDILPELNVNYSATNLAPAPRPSFLHLPRTSAIPLFKHWVACPLDRTIHPSLPRNAVKGASPVSYSRLFM